MDFQAGTLLAERFQETRRQFRRLWLKLWGAGFLIVLLGFTVAWIFVQPAPPRQIVIAAVLVAIVAALFRKSNT